MCSVELEPGPLTTGHDMTPRHVLGIDAGGTKTVCLLADETGRIVGEARAGGANLQVAGELAFEKVLHDVMERAIGDRAIVPAVVCLGIAGVDRAEDEAVVRAVMRRIAYKARVVVVNDALVALVAAVGPAPGVVIVAGTGSIAYGRNAENRAARAGGWGYVLGDEGGGYWIGRQALRAVVRASDGRGRPTSLTARILSHFEVAHVQELVPAVYRRPLTPTAVAALADCVREAHQEGDAVAAEILDGAANELVVAARSVTRQLAMEGEAFPLVLAGGMFRAVPWLAAELPERLRSVAPRSRAIRLEEDPANGAVRLALEALHGGARLPVYI